MLIFWLNLEFGNKKGLVPIKIWSIHFFSLWSNTWVTRRLNWVIISISPIISSNHRLQITPTCWGRQGKLEFYSQIVLNSDFIFFLFLSVHRCYRSSVLNFLWPRLTLCVNDSSNGQIDVIHTENIWCQFNSLYKGGSRFSRFFIARVC